MKLNVDFTLALHNRTGKYFVGRDIIADHAQSLNDINYWRWIGRRTPDGLAAKVLRKLESQEIGVRIKTNGRVSAGLFRPAGPVLHLDPFTVTFHRLETQDAVLCHDLGPVSHPELFIAPVTRLYERAYDIIVAARPRMVFVSGTSQRLFHARYGDDFASSKVIYNPLRTDLSSDAETGASAVEGPYLLTVGSLGVRKNQQRCIEAFAQSGLADRGVRYVLCGSREPGWEAVEALAAATPGVVRLGYVTDEGLAALYRNAGGFVLASLLEGFGVPVAEAVSYGLVPLISEGGVLEEVAGPGALAVDPFDVTAIATGMTALISMTSEDKASRLAQMSSTLSRFSREGFRAGWHAEIQEILAG